MLEHRISHIYLRIPLEYEKIFTIGLFEAFYAFKYTYVYNNLSGSILPEVLFFCLLDIFFYDSRVQIENLFLLIMTAINKNEVERDYGVIFHLCRVTKLIKNVGAYILIECHC